MRINKEQLNLIFTGTSSISALIITLLTLWAVFFTSLPEKMLSEFRTDIKNTKEELIELRQEKREIKKQNHDVLADNYKLESINSSLAKSLQELKNEYSTLQSEVRNYKNKEFFRLDYQYRILATNFLSKVRNILSGNYANSLYLSNLKEIDKWLASEPQLEGFEKIGDKYIFFSNRKEWDEWHSKKPYGLRLYFSFDTKSPESHRKYIRENFIKENKQTLLNAIQASLISTKNNKIEKNAYNKLKMKINNYIKSYSNKLSVFIEPTIYSAYTDDEIINSGKETLKTLDAAKLLVTGLETTLLK